MTTSKSPENDSGAPKNGAKSIFSLNDILKCAAILMCLSVAYKMLYKPDAPQPALPVASGAVQSALPQSIEATAQASGQGQADELKIDTDKIGSLILKKRDAVLAAGPVRMNLNKAPQAASAPAQQSTPAPVPAQAPLAQAPVAQLPNLNPAVSTEQPTVAIAQPGQAVTNKVPKIGFNPDGSQMTPAEKAEQIKGIIAKIPDSWTVNWKAENEKASIYVFTDPTCPYCQKLHRSIEQLNAAGITVHYFMYPRDMGHNTGRITKTQENLNNVWCSIDQKAAMNDAYAGYKIPTTDCASLPADFKRMRSPVADHYFLGELFDVTGTPTIITSSGQEIVGFNTAQSLINSVLN